MSQTITLPTPTLHHTYLKDIFFSDMVYDLQVAYLPIALDKALFLDKKFWYFSYFSMKSCGCSLEMRFWGASDEYLHMF